jgi:filamentous hemagglutinin
VILPGAERAVIDPAKLTDYLLSLAHPIGRFKAAYFARLGFLAEDWRLLEMVLLEAAASGTVQAVEQTRYGRKYRVHGRIEPPRGGTVALVTVWIVLSDEDFPRFVTAFPGEER